MVTVLWVVPAHNRRLNDEKRRPVAGAALDSSLAGEGLPELT